MCRASLQKPIRAFYDFKLLTFMFLTCLCTHVYGECEYFTKSDLFTPSSASFGAAGGSSSDKTGVHSSLLSPSPSPSMADESGGLRGRSGLDERSEGRGSINWVYTSVRTS